MKLSQLLASVKITQVIVWWAILFFALELFITLECAIKIEHLDFTFEMVKQYFAVCSFSMLLWSLPFLILGWFRKLYFVSVLLLFSLNIPYKYLLHRYYGVTTFEDFGALSDFFLWDSIWGFLNGIVGVKNIFFAVIILLFFILIFYFLIHKLWQNKFVSTTSDFILCFLLASLLVGTYVYKDKTVGGARNYLSYPWFMRLGWDYYRYLSIPKYIDAVDNKNISLFKDKLKLLSDSDIIGVVMIGESWSSIPSQVYGYKRQNTPSSVEAFQKGNLVLFKGKTILKASFSALLTSLSLCEADTLKDSPTIFRLLSEMKVSSYQLQGQMHKDTPCKKLFDGVEIITKRNRFDEGMLPALEQRVLNFKSGRECFFMHHKGAHFAFETYCPENFKIFDNINDEYTKGLSKKDRYSYNTYDNCTLYYDYIFGEIIKILEKKKVPSFILLFSDHGEGGYLEKCRNQKNEDKERIYNIPFMIWFSDEYIKKFPQVYNSAKKNAWKVVRNDISVSYSILNLMQIELPEQKHKTPLRDDFIEPASLVR